MIGGPVGASIGAGIGTHTSAMPKEDILRNMALAYGATNIAMGAGSAGATSAARTAASSAGGWSNPFAAAWDGVGAFSKVPTGHLWVLVKHLVSVGFSKTSVVVQLEAWE